VRRQPQLIDDLQFLPRGDLAALIRSLHAVAQESLPLALFGAGLPQLFSQVGEAKSYAERLLLFGNRRNGAADTRIRYQPTRQDSCSLSIAASPSGVPLSFAA
jgi:hypothetical protein